MNSLESRPITNFNLEEKQENIIKVIGVGGGGGNALNYMYGLDVKGVDYVICNTDKQDLAKSPILGKVQIGVEETKGLGAGATPEVGEKAALENLEDIEKAIGHAEMAFITAGLGGGTGTGAAPIIAKLCKDKGILTVAIVTTPFNSEGPVKLENARKGLERLKENVDSLIVVNNNKLCDIYGDLRYREAFEKSNQILSNAAKGIADVISGTFHMNIDMRDARKVLTDSGTALMGVGVATGEKGLEKAMRDALDSPLLDDNRIVGATGALLLIRHGKEDPTMSEVEGAIALIQQESGYATNVIYGLGEDANLQDDEIVVTLVATGFKPNVQREHLGKEPERTVIPMKESQEEQRPNIQDVGFAIGRKSVVAQQPVQTKVILGKTLDKGAAKITPLKGEIQASTQLSLDFSSAESKQTSGVKHNISETSRIVSKNNEVDKNIPAFLRKKLLNQKFREANGISNETINIDTYGNPVVRSNSSYIDDNVD